MNKPTDKIGLVSFVGAGPGDPELLTIKGRKAIERADLLLYAGSLVSPAILEFAKPRARIVDSAYLTLEESHALVKEAALAGQAVARAHTGDPSLYGAMREQCALLERDNIPWEVIPGVTAACAAAAAAGISFSIPELSQTLILTRSAGRTPMPESLAALAKHKTAMAVYLSGKNALETQRQLMESLAGDCPVLCAHRVGWPEERLVWTRLDALAACVRENALERQTIFLILPCEGQEGRPSRLYAADFSHDFRKAKLPKE